MNALDTKVGDPSRLTERLGHRVEVGGQQASRRQSAPSPEENSVGSQSRVGCPRRLPAAHR